MSACPYLESTIAAAKMSLDRALDAEADMAREVRRDILLAYEQIRACQQLIEVERNIATARASAERDNPAGKPPLRLVRR